MLAVIGGSGLTELEDFKLEDTFDLETPFANFGLGDSATGKVVIQRYRHPRCNSQIYFLQRHGIGHKLPPHRVNYRGNIWALRELGVTDIIAVNAVGAIAGNLSPGSLAVPDQLIDYTQGRTNTFFDGRNGKVHHIDFTFPYSESLRQMLTVAAAEVLDQLEESPARTAVVDEERGVAVRENQLALLNSGTYACTEGPRLETAAEIRRLQQDGCDMVGMTGMPEAALARELEMNYAALALSVNWAAGLTDELISMEEITAVIEEGMGRVQSCLLKVAIHHEA